MPRPIHVLDSQLVEPGGPTEKLAEYADRVSMRNLGGTIATAQECNDCDLLDFCNHGAAECHKPTIESKHLETRNRSDLLRSFFV